MNAFIDRIAERKQLNGELEKPGFGFIVLYGRRRIGNTALVLECVKNRDHLYYLSVEKNNLPDFARDVANQFPEAAKLKDNWESLLEFLAGKTSVVILDEFQHIAKEDSAVLSLLQRVIDNHLAKTSLKLILLGSSVSIMTDEVLSQKSPLYGRKTLSAKIEAMPFASAAKFFPNATPAEALEIYGLAGGTPFYLQKITPPFWNWLDNELENASFIKDEMNFLMRYEFTGPGTYKTILEAIANGKTKVNEIKDFARLERTDASPYLARLAEIDFIERRIPVTENALSKNGRYYIKDQFTAFWFKYIYPHLSSIELKLYSSNTVKDTYPAFLGHAFETACAQHLARWIRAHEHPYEKIGGWWKNDSEIDIVALAPSTNSMLLAECKYSDRINAQSIASKLAEKAPLVEWRKTPPTHTFAVYAKSFSKKITEFEGTPVHCFELPEITADRA